MSNKFIQPKSDYDWSDFFELMQYNTIVYHMYNMMCKGAIKTTEQMLIGCICILADENDSIKERLQDLYTKNV